MSLSKNKLRWGILATGFIAHQFASDLKYCKNSKLVAVASRSKDSADAFAEKYGIEHSYTSYEDLASSSEVDVIYIATPHHLHFPNAKLCLEQGKHVLCEKPMTLNAELTQELIDLAKEKQCFLMEAMWTRFNPSVKHALKIVQSGAIGQIKHLVADFGFKARRDPNHRLFNPEYGGGSLLDVGIYPLALSYFFMGQPSSIKSHLHMGPTEVDEQCSMDLKYCDASAQLFSSITVDTKLEFKITGEKGRIDFIGPLFAPEGFVITRGEHSEKIYHTFKGSGYQFEAMAVEQAIAGDQLESDEVSWETSLQIARLMDTVLEHSKKRNTLGDIEHPALVSAQI